MKTVFITGATGYLGSYFLYHLLQHTNDIIYCLARDNGKLSAKERIYQKLDQIHISYTSAGIENADLKAKIKANLNIVTGNITENNLGLNDNFKEKGISEFWHIAANVQFLESNRHEIMDTNVNGGKNILKFIKDNNIPVLNYISTAYVAGEKTGQISEWLADEKFKANNAYEESKRIMEKEIIEASLHGAFNFRIFRPAIIIGHSVTLEQDSSNGGLYGFMYLCASVKDQVDNDFPGYLKKNYIKLRADKNSSLSLIPVDQVVNILFDISNQNTSLNRIYHVTPAYNTSLVRISVIVKKLFGIQLKLVATAENFTLIDRLFNRQVGRYSSYLFYEKQFKRSYELIDYRDDEFLLDNKKLFAMIKRFYDNLKKENKESTAAVAS